jgi:ribosomal protein L32
MSQSPITTRYGSRYASSSNEAAAPGCLVCGAALSDSRAKFCSAAHKQLGYRMRQRARAVPEEPDLRRRLQRQRRLTAHTVYECPTCSERFVGERRCPSCQLFMRAIGLGGHCPECEQPVLLSDLLAEDL